MSSHSTQTPLHLACHKDATPGAVRVLLNYYPEGKTKKKVHFSPAFVLPILSLCIIERYLLFVLIATKIGGKKCNSLPLHIASRNGCDSEILKMLFEAYPAALEKKNSLGDTPFDEAAGHASSQKSLNAMIDGIESH
jgi:ankyrin repeat protein